MLVTGEGLGFTVCIRTLNGVLPEIGCVVAWEASLCSLF